MASRGKRSRATCPLSAEAVLRTPGFWGRLGWMPALPPLAKHPCVWSNLHSERSVEWVVPAYESQLCTSLPNSLFSDATLAAWNWLWWEYLHYRNQQILIIKTFLPREPVANRLLCSMCKLTLLGSLLSWYELLHTNNYYSCYFYTPVGSLQLILSLFLLLHPYVCMPMGHINLYRPGHIKMLNTPPFTQTFSSLICRVTFPWYSASKDVLGLRCSLPRSNFHWLHVFHCSLY